MASEFKEDFLAHYGTPRHSGRYPWGSGKKPQRSKNFVSRVKYYRDQGVPDTEIAKIEGISTTEFRKRLSIAKTESRRADITMANRLKAKGMSNVAIGQRMGVNESQVRSLLKEGANYRAEKLDATNEMLKNSVDSKKYIDVGSGVNKHMGVGQVTLDNAVKNLVDSGEYKIEKINVPQVSNPSNYTTVKVLTKSDVSKQELFDNMDKISMPVEYMVDGDPKNRKTIHAPINIDGKRIMVRYAEDGGTEKEGVMEIRRGVKDLDMGNSNYAQVRIGFQGFDDEYHPDHDNGKYYLKGMAVYMDKKTEESLPDGVDIIFNSNKTKDKPVSKVFKEQKDDPENPFGAEIKRQNDWKDGDEEHLGALNIVSEEGKWGEWKKSLASQVLSKQSLELAKKQLNLAAAESDEEFETIKSLTNPVLKKKLLEEFGDACDADAVDLKAAALPRQASHVILPVPSLKDKEIYAPNYEDGEEVVLIRFPHGGIFEIPRLKVNNKNKEAQEVIGTNPIDAVGINSKVAEQLSGADFDGDTVLVIPTKGVKIKTSEPLEGLKTFDHKAEYGYHEGMRVMTKAMKGQEMGSITNLITDMTLLGAPPEEIERAVKHSMVVIDAEKHKLDFEQSYQDNNIAELKTKYQGGANRGASTLISKATSEQRVANRTRRGIDPETGEILYKEKPETYVKNKKVTDPVTGEVTYVPQLDRQGNPKIVEKLPIKSTKMYEKKDAFELSSGHPMETIYAEYANHMKALGNQARKESLSVTSPTWNRGATTLAYKDEIQSLNNKLDKALMNAPLERKAQMIARQKLKTIEEANPEIKQDKDEYKKYRNIALREGRELSGAGKDYINITDREWEAIQAGAISPTKQLEIFNNCDQDRLKKRAMPRNNDGLSNASKNRIKAMLDAGYTTKDIAEKFDISTSTVSAIKKGE